MRVTVTQLPNTPNELAAAWPNLAAHVQAEKSELVLLPEMIFSPWLAASDQVDPAEWQAAIESHARWMGRLEDLAPAAVLGSRPVVDGDPYNESWLWDIESGLTPAHRKHYLPDEAGFWEATWYRPAPLDFQARAVNGVKVGFMICTDLWFSEHARGYAKQGVHIIANPRATEARTLDKWLAGGRAAAVMAGAYCLSSNHSGRADGVVFGGGGWMIGPDGDVLGVTSDDAPFLTLDIDLNLAEAAKLTYPRDVKE
jgi:N-carbamoylputrescine amidase